jgi:GntR family transcriptional regulator
VQEGREAALSAAAGVPLHRQLYLVLHDEIGRGSLDAGDALPTEKSLCEQFGVRTPRPVAAPLDPRDRGLHVLRLRRERRTGEPLMITEAWLPVELADAITRPALAHAPLYRLLADAGVNLERLEHELTAEIAGPRTAALLDTTIGSPLIRVNRVAFAAGAPHHVLSMVLSPNRSRVVMNQTLSDVESGAGMAIAHDVLRPRS